MQHVVRLRQRQLSYLLATMSNEILSFRQSCNKLKMFNLFRLCRKDKISFTKSSFDIVAKNGNNVEAAFDIVESTISYDKLQCNSTLLPFLSTKSNVASPLLLVWTGLKRLSQAVIDSDESHQVDCSKLVDRRQRRRGRLVRLFASKTRFAEDAGAVVRCSRRNKWRTRD